MINSFIVLLCFLFLSGCAFNQFTLVYKNALKDGTCTTLTQDENYQELKERIAGYFESRGYKNEMFVDEQHRFFVFTKEGDFEMPCEIILKYTESSDGKKVRIDMVRATDDLITENEVSGDIQKIADQIKSH